MQDDLSVFDTSLADLPNGPRLKKISEISGEHGDFQPLGKQHFATFAKDKPILLVTFETVPSLCDLSKTCQPFGRELFKENGLVTFVYRFQWQHLVPRSKSICLL